MKCPVCEVEVDVPRAAYFNDGVYEFLCPNGHPLTVTRTTDATPQEEPALPLDP